MQSTAFPPALASDSMKDTLARLAAPTPTPGGGAVIALAGALGSSLIAMAAGLTRKRERSSAVAQEMAGIERRARAVMDAFTELADADVAAYDAVLYARRLPSATPEEATSRTASIDKALRGAIGVPMRVAEASLEALALAEVVALRGIRPAAGDVAVAALMIHAALDGALRDIEINARALDDAAFSEECRRHGDSLRAEGRRLFDSVITATERII